MARLKRKNFPGLDFQGVYKRGLAVGFSDIRMDCIHFQFKDEKFTVPTSAIAGHTNWNGYFYEMPIAKLRKIAAAGPQTMTRRI